ncbi:DUF5682 family protein [Streptomyces hokutonensis]|uniref:DUF5682 family protein n=1 Tax=Streptomyces hokutonensis TaxID=1306990 RepID=UPI00368C4EDD
MTGTEGAGGPGAGPLLLGVRHHGPGSARAVRAALAATQPRVVLIEGPPEADALIPLAAEEDMRPPVALLAHAVDEPGRSAFWPLAEFSPEWVAIRWALEHGVPARFIDLPAAHTLAWGKATEDESTGEERQKDPPTPDTPSGPDIRVDPLAVLAETAGYDDPERWWEDVVEHRGVGERDPFAPFTALEEAMGALRETYGAGGHDRDLVREAYMRLQVRTAQREFEEGVAVVCGAWHVPALRQRTAVAADRALLKGLPKVKAELTWVPWTHRRLSRAGGYGAGIDSPGWYGHLFAAPDRPVERWMTKVAGLLREEDRIVSPAHVIEAVRLAETLAVMRGRPLPGLGETTDAVRAVMCEGSDVPLSLVRDRLVVGDVLGEVPPGAPAVPLQRDLDRQQRRLRIKPEALERELELDLRKETDAARSRLLHRLRLLGVEWGEPVASRGSTGTFRETWRLRWEPELAVRVAEAGVWGTTVLAAANARAEADAVAAQSLADVTALAEHCLLAELPDALPVVMRVLADRAALDTDVGHLAQALPALVRSLRYGDVRGTDTGALTEVAAGLAERIFVGLPPACTALDADAADEMRRHVDAVHGAVALLGDTGGAGRDAAPGGERGKASGPGHGDVAGLGRGDASAPGDGGAAEPGHGEASARGNGEGSGPEYGESSARGRGEGSGPADGEAQAPWNGEGSGPADGETSARGNGEGSGPEYGESSARGHGEGSGPADGEAQAPRNGEGAGPEYGEASARGNGEGSGPEYGETSARGRGEGSGSADGEAQAPRNGEGSGPAYGEAPGPERRDASVAGGADAPALGHGDLRRRWRGVLRTLSARDTVPGVIRGRAVRLLLDGGELGPDEAARLMGLVLSPGTPPTDAAAWIEGFVGGGGGLLLVHDERLLGLVDAWLTGVSAEAFTDVLPLLRRTFSAYEPGVRRTLGELVSRGPGKQVGAVAAAVGISGFGAELDAGRADAVVPVLRLMLGLDDTTGNSDNELAGVAG